MRLPGEFKTVLNLDKERPAKVMDWVDTIKWITLGTARPMAMSTETKRTSSQWSRGGALAFPPTSCGRLRPLLRLAQQ